MSNLPDWLEAVDSYDKATPWPGSSGCHTSVFPNGHLTNDTEESLTPRRQWVRVRSYREGVEAALAAIEACGDLSAVHRKDGVLVLNDAMGRVKDLLAPPKPPLKFGEMIETVGIDGGWVDAVFIKLENERLSAIDDGTTEVMRYSLSHEGKTWRRKS